MPFLNQPVTAHDGNQYLLYDKSVSGQLTGEWFDAEFWEKNAEVQSTGLGRGSAWFILTPQEHYVLRHYRRGGWVSRISTDRYIWTGLQNTRAWREWKLLARLYIYKLPAPVPVAARVHRLGLLYTADLLTIKLQAATSLSACLAKQELPGEVWSEIGKTIYRFHQHQIFHADLNAHNILVNESGQVSLIDFDKGYVRTGTRWYADNLQRLNRSLKKLGSQKDEFHFSEEAWQKLSKGYQESMT